MIEIFENLKEIKGYYDRDWVRIFRLSHKPYCRSKQLSIKDIKEQSITTYPMICFMPICLSTSILKENGFNITNIDLGWLCTYNCKLIHADGGDENINIHIRLSINGDASIYIFNDDEVLVSLKIKYVHELQHILRLCNLSKFADYLEISDDIQNKLNESLEKSYEDYQKRQSQLYAINESLEKSYMNYQNM